MPDTKSSALKELRHSIRLDDIKHDPFGTAMAWGFAVCLVLDTLGESIPDEWGYRRAMGDHRSLEEIAGDPESEEGREDIEFPDSDVALMVLSGRADADTLLYWGRVLDRYINLCKHHGRDY